MKVKYFLVLFLLLIFSAFALPDGVKVSAGTAKSSADAEEIKKRVIENCGLDPYWTAYMAVYGYVYGDYLYFYKSAEAERDIYRIRIKDYKLEEYVSDVYTPEFVDDFVFYNDKDYKLNAKNLNTGKTIKLASDGWSGQVRLYKERIYYIDNYRLYTIKTDGSDKKLIASKVYGSLYNLDLIFIYKDHVFYMKDYYEKNSKFIIGKKIYRCDLDGSNRKCIKKVKVSMGRAGLMIRNGKLLIVYYDENIDHSIKNEPLDYNALYIYKGKKFKKLGASDDYPQYDVRRTEGYVYRAGNIKNGKPDYEEFSNKIIREDKKGNWTVFGSLPYAFDPMDLGFEMQNGYLVVYVNWGGDEVDRIMVYDKMGNIMADVEIAGRTDECWMYAAVVGERVYIIHHSYMYSNSVHRNIDKCEVIEM